MVGKNETAANGSKLTEEQWRSIVKTLPPGIDQGRLRNELERIAHDISLPRKLAQERWDRVELCKRFNQALPKMDMIGNQGPLSQQLRLQIEWDGQLAKSYEQIAKQKTPRKFLRQCRVLWAWKSAGGDIGITTRPGKAPEGAVIPFFQAASVVVGGKTPGAWQIKDIVSCYQKVNYAPIVSVSKVTAEPTFIPRAPDPVDEATPAVDAIGEDQEHSE